MLILIIFLMFIKIAPSEVSFGPSVSCSLLLIDLNRAHWQLEIPFKVKLWRFLSPYDVDTLTHNKLPLFITGPCKSANPLKKF